ncbi:hypothetical protein PanWU01x14_114940 [Parasponia andersonii]|uniref:Uncharacterized protein n=1 Tax=Parasponia andersonii TaxID=3476 RepID=A0A2P5CXK4_PARAD|nr:hypothetical protein PanWU01x14_114940 [Parasponia andersonii]
MPMAAGTVASPSDRVASAAVVGPAMVPMPSPAMTVMPDSFAKEAMLAWFRGEFAAANAIIDVLCGHLAQLSGGGSEYEAVFAAVHRRRLNWIPILQMQKYHSIADVAVELRRVAAKRAEELEECRGEKKGEVVKNNSCLDGEKVVESNGNGWGDDRDDRGHDEVVELEEDSPNSEITDTAKAWALRTSMRWRKGSGAAGITVSFGSSESRVGIFQMLRFALRATHFRYRRRQIRAVRSTVHVMGCFESNVG